MKKFPLITFCIAFIFIGIFSVQAEIKDVPLKRSDDPNAVTSARVKKNVTHQRTYAGNPFQSNIFNPFVATIVDDVFYIDVVMPVGTVQVLVRNEYGEVEYAGAYDSASLDGFALSVENWMAGDYQIVISYGSAYFAGEFNIE
jgi:hypothetical protein